MNKKKINRLEETFSRLKKTNKKALITFITAGDPDIDVTGDIILVLERSGADIIELGIPFSDPMADGPTIQASSERALKGGVTISKILSVVAGVRKRSQIPIILFGYYNPIFSYGLDKITEDAARAGADGFLVVDLPPEEAGEFKRYTDLRGLDLIFLLTPTSDDDRMRLVAKNARGFVYYVSVTGVTGVRNALPLDIKEHIKTARKFTNLPIGVGFGISTPEQARTVSECADAIVVGSAIVKIIAENHKKSLILKGVENFVKGLKEAMDG